MPLTTAENPMNDPRPRSLGELRAAGEAHPVRGVRDEIRQNLPVVRGIAGFSRSLRSLS